LSKGGINLKYNYEELQVWKDYQEGIDFKRRIGLYADVDKNSNFYQKKMWLGVQAGNLPTPVLPLIPRIVDHKVNTVMGDDIKINYSIDGIDDTDYSPDKELLREVSKKLSAYAMTLWENLQEDSRNEQALLDAALSGDGIEYFYWDASVDAGDGVKGQIKSMIIDNVNYFPANPNDPDVQSQVKIQIAFRQMVEDLKKEAKANGVSKEEIDKIVSDEETENQAGEMSKVELSKSNKAICLLTMWKEEYPAGHINAGQAHVVFNKCTRYAKITKGDVDSKLSLYPVALMNWALQKNCCHGVSEVTGLIPNQIAINKLVAMIIMAVQHISIPKMVYDATRVAPPSNIIGGQIGVQGGNIKDCVGYITPGQLSSDIYQVVNLLIDKTKEMVAATDAAMGELNMDNTSALVVLQKASAIPLKSISRRFWRFIEDKARIWMDFFINKYNIDRTLTYTDNGITKTFTFNGNEYRDLQWRVKVDIGASSHWSEITSIQTMDNLLMNKHINFAQYLERLPNGVIPMKDKLLQEIAGNDMDGQVMVKMLADYVEGLPPEMQEQIRSMPPEQMEQAVKEMILQEPQQLNNQAVTEM
jgi:hypothetical protein